MSLQLALVLLKQAFTLCLVNITVQLQWLLHAIEAETS